MYQIIARGRNRIGLDPKQEMSRIVAPVVVADIKASDPYEPSWSATLWVSKHGITVDVSNGTDHFTLTLTLDGLKLTSKEGSDAT